jgi:hypothetical protein
MLYRVAAAEHVAQAHPWRTARLSEIGLANAGKHSRPLAPCNHVESDFSGIGNVEVDIAD